MSKVLEKIKGKEAGEEAVRIDWKDIIRDFRESNSCRVKWLKTRLLSVREVSSGEWE